MIVEYPCCSIDTKRGLAVEQAYLRVAEA